MTKQEAISQLRTSANDPHDRTDYLDLPAIYAALYGLAPDDGENDLYSLCWAALPSAKRYQVFAIDGDDRERTSLTEWLAERSTFSAANQYAEAHANEHYYGTAISDEQAKLIYWGDAVTDFDGNEVESDGRKPITARKYQITIDSGQGGSEIIRARNPQSAMNRARRWAKAGSWDKYGDVIVRVNSLDGSTLAEEHVTVGRPWMPPAECL